MEHQLSNCGGYPKQQQIIFDNIYIEWEGVHKDPNFQALEHNPVCKTTSQVLNNTSVMITWST